MINPSSINWQKSPDGLVPAIVQDVSTSRVLMLGYMNREALERTLATGDVTFYSRSRQRLWTKGETSGHRLQLVSASVDCDNDALLVRAIPVGPTCHLGRVSCFEGEETAVETLGELIRTIAQRANAEAGGSYTKQLLDGGVTACGEKVTEEAEEVVRAATSESPQRTVEEAADLLYHLFVLLRARGTEIDDVSRELRNRRKTGTHEP